MVFKQDEIEEAVMDHFTEAFKAQRVPVFTPGDVPDQVDMAMLDIEKILAQTPDSFEDRQFEADICSPFTIAELDQTLDSLPNGKAAGTDNIPNELLKNSNLKSRLYIQSFLNKILSDGEVPEDLNLGKCMLIFKVIRRNHLTGPASTTQ